MASPRLRPRSALVVALGLAWLVAQPPASGQAAWSTPTVWMLARGIRLQRWADPSVPRRIFVLRLDPDVRPGLVSIDPAMARPSLPGAAKVSEIGAARAAFAAINGDFGTNRPDHPFASDGELWQNGPQRGFSFAITHDERSTYFGDPRPRVVATAPTGTFAVAEWNDGAPAGDEIAAYTPRWGSLESPPNDACSVRLDPVAGQGLRWAAHRDGILRTYRVAASPALKAELDQLLGPAALAA